MHGERVKNVQCLPNFERSSTNCGPHLLYFLYTLYCFWRESLSMFIKTKRSIHLCQKGMTAHGLTVVTVEDYSWPNPDAAVRAEGLPVHVAQRMKSKLQKPGRHKSTLWTHTDLTLILTQNTANGNIRWYPWWLWWRWWSERERNGPKTGGRAEQISRIIIA
jgi:hypothetical protein